MKNYLNNPALCITLFVRSPLFKLPLFRLVHYESRAKCHCLSVIEPEIDTCEVLNKDT